MKRMWIVAALPLALAACSNDYVPEAAPPKAPEIHVGLASTRLGSDCNEPSREISASGESTPRGAKPDLPIEPAQRIPCDQTAVHLSVRAEPGTWATTIKMKRVELLDRDGKLLEVLKSHSPSRWGTDSFVAWDESTIPGQTLSVGYKLSSPDWSKIPNANSRSFKMRVTVTVGDRDRTFEATAELRIEDTSNVVT